MQRTTMTNSNKSRRGGIAQLFIIFIAALFLTAIVVAFAVMHVYNKVQSLDERVTSAWAQVDTVLQRRFDLIPNLVETVKGYAKQEKDVLTEVTRLRSQWGEASTQQAKANVATQMESALSRLMVVVEKYPELKSNENFLALQSQLEGTENRIAVERRRYNETLQEYNTYVRQIPGRFFGQPKDSYFKAAEESKKVPQVKF
jgi:LemA protein